jgi:two-component system OmpR family response regulator
MTVVAEACDGRDAMEKAQSLLPDVVILDLSMPNMNGLFPIPDPDP